MDIKIFPNIIVPVREVKKSVVNKIKKEGLYYLETLFNRVCSGHGSGLGSEDISFSFGKNAFAIDFDGKVFVLWAYDGNGDSIPLSPAMIRMFENMLPKGYTLNL